MPKQEIGHVRGVNAGQWTMTEMEPTDAGAESSRPRAEKEPEGPAAGLWMRVTELRRKGRLGSRMKVMEEC